MPKAKINEYSKEELEQIIKTCTSMREFMTKLDYPSISGSSMKAVKNRLDFLNISYDHFVHKTPCVRNKDNVFCNPSTADQKTLRKFYLNGNYSPYKCSICGQPPEWNGQPLTLILDHISGEHSDSRLENLRWVCPNCNQQLPTTGYKIMRSKSTNS